MKKIIYSIIAILCLMISLESCNNSSDNLNKLNFNNEVYHGNKLLLRYAGVDMKGKSVVCNSINDKLNINLLDIIPGDSISVIDDVELDDKGNFAGEVEEGSGTRIKYAGSIDGNSGKMTLDLDVRLSDSHNCFVGEWELSHDKSNDFKNSPIRFIWTGLDETSPNGSATAETIMTFGSFIIPEFLNNIHLYPDGSLTAGYYTNIEMGEGNTLLSWIMSNVASSLINPLEREWFELPKNNIQWYFKDNTIYFKPNIVQILDKAGDKIPIDSYQVNDLVASLSSLDDNIAKSALQLFGKYFSADFSDVDVSVAHKIGNWTSKGIAIKYKLADGNLKLYVDKEMIEAYIPIFFAFIPSMQEALNEYMKEHSEVSMVLMMMKIKQLSDLKTFWEENTDKFEIEMTFTKKTIDDIE